MKRKKSLEAAETEASVPDGLGRSARRSSGAAGGRVRRRVWAASLAVVIGLVLIGIAWFVARSPLLRVSFAVEGAPPNAHERLITSLSALAIADSPALGILGPNHLFVWMSAPTAETRIRIDTMLIAATPKLSLWDRQVTIAATVRNIVGVWCAENAADNCYGFDEEGVLLAEVPKTEGSLILVVTDESNTARVLGQRIVPNPAWITRLYETLEAIRESGEQISRLTVREAGLHEWEATLASGPTLEFSFDFMPADLVATLRKLKAEVAFEKLATVDFRIPGRLYYR